jgi:hypothetical protein
MITRVSAANTTTLASFGGGGTNSPNARNVILGALRPLEQRAGTNEAMTLQADTSLSPRVIDKMTDDLVKQNPSMNREDARKIIAAWFASLSV